MNLCIFCDQEVLSFTTKFDGQKKSLVPRAETTAHDAQLIITGDLRNLNDQEFDFHPLVLEWDHTAIQSLIEGEKLQGLDNIEAKFMLHNLENVYLVSRKLHQNFLQDRLNFVKGFASLLASSLDCLNASVTYRGVEKKPEEQNEFHVYQFDLETKANRVATELEEKIFSAYRYATESFECLGFKKEIELDESQSHIGYLVFNFYQNLFVVKIEGVDQLNSLQEIFLKTFANTFSAIAKEFAPKVRRKVQPQPGNEKDTAL